MTLNYYKPLEMLDPKGAPVPLQYSYTGNISQWKWHHDDSDQNLYAFDYDPLRPPDGRQEPHCHHHLSLLLTYAYPVSRTHYILHLPAPSPVSVVLRDKYIISHCSFYRSTARNNRQVKLQLSKTQW